VSKIKNDSLTRSGTRCFTAVPIYGNSGRQRVKRLKLFLLMSELRKMSDNEFQTDRPHIHRKPFSQTRSLWLADHRCCYDVTSETDSARTRIGGIVLIIERSRTPWRQAWIRLVRERVVIADRSSCLSVRPSVCSSHCGIM